MHGKDITVPQGHEVTVYTNSDYTPATMAGAAPGSPATTSGPVLTNADILTLKKAGFGDQLLIAKIKSSRGNYQLGATDLVSLKNAGVSDAVMAAMMEAKR
jgi:hypothetical protein